MRPACRGNGGVGRIVEMRCTCETLIKLPGPDRIIQAELETLNRQSRTISPDYVTSTVCPHDFTLKEANSLFFYDVVEVKSVSVPTHQCNFFFLNSER